MEWVIVRATSYQKWSICGKSGGDHEKLIPGTKATKDVIQAAYPKLSENVPLDSVRRPDSLRRIGGAAETGEEKP